jgi:hypothetical protein
MEPENLTLRILGERREEQRSMREEMRDMREEMRDMHRELGDVRDEQCRIHQRLEIIEGTLLETAGQLRVIARGTRVVLDAKNEHEERFEDLERRVSELERGRAWGRAKDPEVDLG